MIYTSTSLDSVIGRILRNTRVQDASYTNDMNEWIPEAMGYMKTRVALVGRWEDITIKYHKGRLPCGTVSLQGIQYGNARMRYYKPAYSAGALKSPATVEASVYPGISPAGVTPFGTQIVVRETTDGDVPVVFYETSLESLENLSFCDAWYYTELDYINTSFCDGCIRVFYKGIPVDSKGLPLIPDDEYYKEALYWYVRAKMIGCGYEDKVFNESTCMDRFETAASRAISRITYPSVDEQESKIKDITRFILPENIWHL